MVGGGRKGGACLVRGEEGGVVLERLAHLGVQLLEVAEPLAHALPPPRPRRPSDRPSSPRSSGAFRARSPRNRGASTRGEGIASATRD